MDPLTTVLPFAIAAFTTNADAKRFGSDFVSAFIAEIRPLFLIDEPKAESILSSNDANAKESFIRTKLLLLAQDPDISDHLKSWAERIDKREKNIVNQVELTVDGDVNIGDSNNTSQNDNSLTKKNVVSNSTVKSGGSFNVGDRQ